MLKIINGELYCPKLSEFVEIPIVYKKIIGTNIYFEL